jgi:two-component sensor histidine kinase/HAMP domain-containing protein
MNKIKNIVLFIYNLVVRKIVWKIVLWGWMITLVTILIVYLYLIPLQKNTALERMDSEASDIASSILVANQSALITDDYSLVVEHCQKVVSDSKSIMYIVITKKNGFSMIYTKDGWNTDNLSGMWLPDSSNLSGDILYSSFVKQDVFHKSVGFSYLGIFWGYLHVGISLDKYHRSIDQMQSYMMKYTILTGLIGFMISIFLAKKITKPILVLDQTTKRIAEGDINARATIKSGDEIESLANSFNLMTDSLQTANENLEQKVKERTKLLEETNEALVNEVVERSKIELTLERSLEEKDVLIKEIHHRVKNNLQIISSLLNMQSKSVTDEKSLTIFKDSQTRIKSMALVHEKLYKTKEFSRINIAEYIINLVNYVHQTYSSDAKIITTVYDLDNIELPIDIATPLGLIINELILNIFKYAFVDNKNGKDNIINVRAKQLTPNPSSILFEVSDNGVGLPKDFSIEESNSLGLKLVFNLCQQIDAKLNIESDNGTKFSFTITEGDSDNEL